MKDFTFRNDTELLFRNDIKESIAHISKGHKVMLVYVGGSAKSNGSYADITEALNNAGVPFVNMAVRRANFRKY